MHHLVKAVDKLVLVAEKQGELAHELQRHSDSFTRVFDDMGRLDSKQAGAINSLTAELRTHREQASVVADTVTGYKASLRTLMYVGGALTGLLVLIGSMFAAQQVREQNRTNADVGALEASMERRKLADDIKLDVLTQQVQEVRLDRQRDREAEGKLR